VIAFVAALLFTPTVASSAPSAVAPLPFAFLTDNREDPARLQTLWSFGQCAAQKDTARMFTFLKNGQFAKPNDPTVRLLIAANDRCVRSGETLTFNQVYFAGAAAETIYRLSGFRFAERPISKADVQSLSSLKSKSVLMGACVAALQPRQVDALFATPIASAAEARIILSMREAVQTCLPGVKRTPEMIRAVIAAGAFPAVSSMIARGNLKNTISRSVAQ